MDNLSHKATNLDFCQKVQNSIRGNGSTYAKPHGYAVSSLAEPVTSERSTNGLVLLLEVWYHEIIKSHNERSA